MFALTPSLASPRASQKAAKKSCLYVPYSTQHGLIHVSRSLPSFRRHIRAAAARMPFGKHRGVPLSEVPSTYINWLCVRKILDKPEHANLRQQLLDEKLVEVSPTGYLMPALEMPFGKHKGTRLKNLPLVYVRWLCDEGILDQPQHATLRRDMLRLGLVVAPERGDPEEAMTVRPAVPVMPFGKHKGKPLDRIDETYFEWLYEQCGEEGLWGIPYLLDELLECGQMQWYHGEVIPANWMCNPASMAHEDD